MGYGMGFGATPRWYFHPCKVPLAMGQVNSLLAVWRAPAETAKKQVANHGTM